MYFQMCVYICIIYTQHMLTYIINNLMAEHRLVIKEIQKCVCVVMQIHRDIIYLSHKYMLFSLS